MSKILLVEDDNNLREIYEARLQAEGYEIISARDGEEALTIAMKERPDLIISDVMMPKISGFDMLDILRSTPETKDTKVIMMTALSQAEDKERATRLGADRYLVKSQVTLEDVARVAREVLEGPAHGDAQLQTASTSDPSAPLVATAATPQSAPTTPEPVISTPEPATVVSAAPDSSSTATTPSSAPEPTPVVVVPTDPEPVANSAPLTNDTEPAAATSAAAEAITSAGLSADVIAEASNEAKSLGDSLAEEQSAIAAQIESFIDSKKTAETPGVEAPPIPEITAPEITATSNNPVPAEQTQVAADPEQTKKKIIQPLNDPNASSSSNLEDLLEKENQKEQMAQIARDLSENAASQENPSVNVENIVSEPVHEEALSIPEVSSDLVNSQTEANQDVGVFVAPAAEPITPPAVAFQPVGMQVPEAVPAPVNPVIPHTNGTSMDGVSQPQPGTVRPVQPAPVETTPPTDGIDPNSIAL